MTDRELLEAAAKAAGITAEWYAGLGMCTPGDAIPRQWNPLDDDGDALRLANNRQLDIRHANGKVHAGFAGEFWCTENWFPDGDKNAATRRAITRAAAASSNVAGGTR